MVGSTRDAVLDAAYDAVVAGSWAGTRMADVAAAAGVSRQTIYNTFGSKERLAAALAARHAARFIAEVEQTLAATHPRGPAAAVARSVEVTLARAAEDPLLKAVLTDDAGGLLPYLTTRAAPILAAARASIAAYLLRAWPGLPPAEVELAADAVVRLTVSHLVLPGDDPDTHPAAVAARLAHLVERLLDPHEHQ